MNEVRNIIVGLELGEKTSQICYYDRNEKEPVSLNVTGQSNCTFPTILSKKPGEEVYHFGVEAEYFGVNKNEILIDNLYDICRHQASIELDNQKVSPALLLKYFLSGALKILGVADLSRNIRAIMITVPRISKELVANVKQASELLRLDKGKVFLQEYNESFYYHTRYQKQELSTRKVALFTVGENAAAFSELDISRRTKPALVTVRKGEQTSLSNEADERDEQFYQFAKKSFGEDAYSSVFIIGNGFDKSWSVRSIPLLCRHQRPVFYGNNLYAKGACYAALDKAEGKALKEYLFAGPDLVKVNIGMDLVKSGIATYYSLIEAGVNWYEASAECEILLNDIDELVFKTKRMDRSEKNRCVMALPNLPKRPPKATRIKIKVAFDSANHLNIEAEDLGLGELYPASGLIWHEAMMC